ncbi:MAG: sialidase family protein [Bryobacteraceae bacterium]
MKRRRFLTGGPALAVLSASSITRRTLRYGDGKPHSDGSPVRTHQVRIGPVRGEVFVYCTFEMGSANPIPGAAGETRGEQRVTLGYSHDGRFIPVLSFGLRDAKGVPGATQLAPWAADGTLDYHGGFARPHTPYDFKLKLDLMNKTIDAWTCGRGDDEWFLLADSAPLPRTAARINEARVEQFPDAAGIDELRVQSGKWPEGEAIRPHPMAKKNRVVRPGAGFRLQSMRSTWRKPGRHVTISRDQNRWQGFADVVLSKANRLLVTYCDGRAHGGGGKAVIRTSDDLGKSWSAETTIVPTKGANERLQRLRDGSLLLISGERVPKVEFKRSTDDGITWNPVGGFDIHDFGLKVHYAMSHVVECSDGSWLTAGSDSYPIGEQAFDNQNRFRIRERLQVYQSTDKGKTWSVRSLIDSYPSSGHAGSEASILELSPGRLVIYARDSRNDGYPGFRIFSEDAGKTWSQPEDLPIQVVGRVGADFLSDGRVMLTTRTAMGYPALWAWIDDPQAHPGFRIGGIHFNDHASKGLKDGVLHIDSDGRRGQFTRYLLRPPESPECRIELSAEVMVKENLGHAATISLPFAGQLRIFPDRVVFVGSETVTERVAAGRFRTYRMVSGGGEFQLWIDGELRLRTSKLDSRVWKNDWSPAQISALPLAFGNFPQPEIFPPRATATSRIYGEQISPEVTGLSLWKRVEATTTPSNGREYKTLWAADRDGFPDQYQLDHVIQVEGSVYGGDQGYSGWAELPDGRIFVVNYTDDTAVAWPATGAEARWRCPWIRGTYLLPSDLRGT